MTTIASITSSTSTRRLGVLDRLALSSMVGLALALVYAQVMLIGEFDPALSIFTGLLLLGGVAVCTRRRWAPLLAALLAALVVAGNSGPVIYDLSHPEARHSFVFMVVTVAFSLVGIAGGIGAGIQRYRGTTRHTPRGTFVALAALIGLCVGAVLVSALPRPAGGVASEVLAPLPALTSPGMHFDQVELRAQVGMPVAMRFANPHSVPHSFDIDELNVHVPVSPGEETLILFVPEQAGTYRFYCGVPGHTEAGMVGTLTVEP